MRTLALGAAALLLGAVGAWWWMAPGPPAAVAQAGVPPAAPALPSPFGSGPVVAGPDAPPPAPLPAAPPMATPAGTVNPPPAAAGDMAPGLSLAELLELKAELDASPNPNDEASRMTQELLHTDAVQRLAWLLRQGGPPAGEVLGLARFVDQGLDTRLARGELSADQALQHKALVLQASVANPAQRQQLMQQWQQRQPLARPGAASAPR